MTEKITNKDALNFLEIDKVQNYFSLGYLYLLVLGLISYSIFYGLIGVDIVSYSNVLDILLSPIILFTSKISIMLVVIGVILIGYYYPKFRLKYLNKNLAKDGDSKNYEKKLGKLNKFSASIPVLVLSLYLGIAVGGGLKYKERIEQGTLNFDHQITFSDGKRHEVSMIGTNSEYIIYVISGTKQLTISPIDGYVRRIEKIKQP